MANLSIVVRAATSMVAPAGLYLEAIELSGFDVPGGPGPGEVYDPSFHEITYLWTVRGAPLGGFENTDLNLPAAWGDQNVAYGKKAAFVLPAGTYEIDLFAVDRSGNWSTATAQFVVAAADSAYPAAETICYSETDFAGAPSGAQQVASLADLNSALSAAGGAASVRVLLRAGHDFSGAVRGPIRGDYVASLALGTFGNGGRATLPALRNAQVLNAPTGEQKVFDIDIAGGWDETRERGVLADPQIGYGTAGFRGLVTRCTINGVAWPLTTPYFGGAFAFWFHDLYVTNFRFYGLYDYAANGGDTSNVYFALIGASFARQGEANQGGNSALRNYGAAVRTEGPRHWYVGMCDFFSRAGWSGGFPGTGTADQSAFRVNTRGDADCSINFDRCAFEGGFQVVSMTGESTGTQEVPGNYLFDKCLFVGSAETQKSILGVKFGGTTIRNSYFMAPDVPMNSGGYEAALLRFDMDSPHAVNQNAPVQIYNSTFLCLLTSANNKHTDTSGTTNPAAIYHDGNFANYTAENNVVHFPNIDAPETSDAPIDTSTPLAGFVPRFAGRKDSLPVLVQAIASTAPNASFTIPYGSLADKDGNATSQAYWTGRDPGDTMHALSIDGERYYAQEGEFSVTFGASNVTVTNTSGVTWPAQNAEIALDHSSLQATMDASFASPSTIPLPRPGTTSAAHGAGGLGTRAEDDFLAAPRRGSALPAAPAGARSQGAFEPV